MSSDIPAGIDVKEPLDYMTPTLFEQKIALRTQENPVKYWKGVENVPANLKDEMESGFMNPRRINEKGRILGEISLILGRADEGFELREARAIERVTGFFDGLKNGVFLFPDEKKGVIKKSVSTVDYDAIRTFCDYAKNLVIGAIKGAIIEGRNTELGNKARAELAGIRGKFLSLVE